MPDIFVPVDTTYSSQYLDKIYRKGLIYSFSYLYTDKNRHQLTKFKSAKKMAQHIDNDDVLTKFTDYAKSKGVNKDAEGIRKSGKIIKTQIKAYVARNILGEEGFYPIIKENDETLLKAIEIAKTDFMQELTK